MNIILKFFINDNNNQFLIRRDTTRVIADSKQFLEFTLDSPVSWNGFSVTAIFQKGTVISTVIDITENTAFKVPSPVLAGEGALKVSFEAVKDGISVITTNPILIDVFPSGTGGIELPIPTIENPDPFAQYLSLLEAERTKIENFTSVMTKKFSQNIGDDLHSEFEIIHNLDAQDVIVSIVENIAPFNTILCGIQHLDVNTVQLMFSRIPAQNEYRVIVVG